MRWREPWKDSELTLADLASLLNTTPHKLSEVLNAQIGETFYDFVNGYRVREVQRRIAAGEGKALKILALALDAGFASKSTFNQVFKKHTSQTPSDFRQALRGLSGSRPRPRPSGTSNPIGPDVPPHRFGRPGHPLPPS